MFAGGLRAPSNTNVRVGDVQDEDSNAGKLSRIINESWAGGLFPGRREPTTHDLGDEKKLGMMSQNGTLTEAVNTVGLGYGIAIAVGVLVLVSTVMLASYVCARVQGRPIVGGITASSRRGEGIALAQGGAGAGAGELPGYGGGARTREIDGYGDDGAPEEWVIGGLDEMTVESYPKLIYGDKKDYKKLQEDTCCSICLGDYSDGELLRLLPDCGHVFHATCIDPWLRLHASCPVCRTSPLPTPQSTPLSELIPLARHPLHSR